MQGTYLCQNTGCPNKNTARFQTVKTFSKMALGIKAGWVWKSSGSPLSYENRNGTSMSKSMPKSTFLRPSLPWAYGYVKHPVHFNIPYLRLPLLLLPVFSEFIWLATSKVKSMKKILLCKARHYKFLDLGQLLNWGWLFYFLL